MITKWKVFNFKSIQKETELDFAPLTIFAGANSSGKSTLIQSILLIAQTLSHKIGQRPIILNGTLTRLGQFDDLRSFDSGANEIAIGWECQPTPDPESAPQRYARRAAFYSHRGATVKRAACEITFDADPSDPKRDLLQLQPQLFSCQLSSTSRDEDGADSLASITIIRRSSLFSDDSQKEKWLEAARDNTIARNSLNYEIVLDETSVAELREAWVSAEPVGCMLRHFLPDRLSLGVDMVEEDANVICSVITGDITSHPRRRYYRDREVNVPSKVIQLLRDSIDFPFDNLLRDSYPSLFDEIEQSLPVSKWVQWVQRLSPRERLRLRNALIEVDDIDERSSVRLTG